MRSAARCRPDRAVGLSGPRSDPRRTRGNPLALLELPRGLTPQELAGGFGLPSAMRLSGGIEENFRRRLEALPDQTRSLLLIAAAEPVGDPALVWRAAARLGIGAEAAAPAIERALSSSTLGCGFVIPSCGQWSTDRRCRKSGKDCIGACGGHRSRQDPDRRAWHRAHAAPGPDEEVAAELVRSAGRAQARGGIAAAAAFLARATALTLDPVRRTERALEAASAKVKAGAFDAARDLLSIAEAGPLRTFSKPVSI